MRTACTMGPALVVVLLLGAARAEAQSDETTTAVAAPEPYPGVVPGQGNRPPAAGRAERQRGRAVVTWPGFEISPYGSRIFVQATRAVTWERRDSADRIVIVLHDATIHLHNNLNPLVTQFFPVTPVASARLERHRRDLHLVIELKAASGATVTTQQGDDGYFYLFVDFPAGQYLTPESDLPAYEEGALESRNIGGSLAVRRGRSRSGAAESEEGAAEGETGGTSAETTTTEGEGGTTTTTTTTRTTHTTTTTIPAATTTPATTAPATGGETTGQ